MNIPPKQLFTRVAVTALLGSFFPLSSAMAASSTWLSVATNGNFADSANWQGSVRPGSTTINGTDDKAIFKTVSNHSTINFVNPGNYKIGAIAFEAGTGAYTFTGATLPFNAANPGVAGITMDSGVTAAQTFNNTVSFGGGNPFLRNNATNSAATLTFAAMTNFRLDTATTTTLHLEGTNTGNNTISGAISEITERKLSVNKKDAGTWNLSGVSSYTGTTTVSGGTLIISGNGSINTTSSISINGNGAVLRYDSSVALSKAITLGANGGTLLYNSSAAYTGEAISAGTLQTVGGSGSLKAVTITSGGTLTPGQLGDNSAGTLTVTSLTLQSGATTRMDILTAALYDAVASSGAVQLGGTLYLNFDSLLANGVSLTLFGGTFLTGDFSSIIATGAYSGTLLGEGDTHQLSVGGQIVSFDAGSGSLRVIPEPSSLILLVVASLGALGGHLRRRVA